MLRRAVGRIVEGYRQGSRYGIRADADGLLAAGEPGLQLTWMDVKIGDWVVTPRIGKPVEIQALWLNALAIARGTGADCGHLYRRARAAFQARFWNPERGCLYDVVDADHVPGRDDPSFRPNQILAVGGLPFQLLDEPQAGRVVEAVECLLVTPMGLRSLARGEPGYRPRYEGGPAERDSAYHQGTVWPWLVGPYVDARRAAGQPVAGVLDGLIAHLPEYGLGSVSETADGDPPHGATGCPFQAWSVAEVLRVRASG